MLALLVLSWESKKLIIFTAGIVTLEYHLIKEFMVSWDFGFFELTKWEILLNSKENNIITVSVKLGFNK